jgi:hypothetical protein
MTTVFTILDAAEVALREKCLTTIRAHRDGFIAAGEALEKVRDSRLYRDSYATFEDFCKAELGQGKAYAYRLIDAAHVVSPIGDKSAITTESQARELSKVKPKHRAAVVEKAIAATGGKITAAAIREAAKPDKSEDVEVTIEAPLRHLSAADMTEAHDLWLIAKGRLDNIRKNDPERVAILREVIAYAQQRINHNK